MVEAKDLLHTASKIFRHSKSVLQIGTPCSSVLTSKSPIYVNVKKATETKRNKTKHAHALGLLKSNSVNRVIPSPRAKLISPTNFASLFYRMACVCEPLCDLVYLTIT